MKLAPVVVIDSREQAPWEFINLPTEPGTLDAGDYSVRGLTHLIGVERKTLPDLLACVGRGRDRFKRELQRLRAYRFRCLVVEADLAHIEAGDWRGKVQPAHVLGSLAAWQAQYGLPVVFGGSREASARYGERWLYQAARVIAAEVEAVSGCTRALSDEFHVRAAGGAGRCTG